MSNQIQLSGIYSSGGFYTGLLSYRKWKTSENVDKKIGGEKIGCSLKHIRDIFVKNCLGSFLVVLFLLRTSNPWAEGHVS